MNSLQKILCIGAGVLALSLSGSKYSDIRHENAVVISKERIPPHTEEGPVSMEGSMAPYMQQFTCPEEYIIIFDGQIDFRVDNKDIYNRFKVGDKADVSYKKIYRTYYGQKLKDYDYKFVNANPKK